MSPSPGVRELVRRCVRALEDKKAEDLRVLDVSAQSSLTDCLILATGTSEPHLRALRLALEEALAAAGARVVGREAAPESGWTVVDAFDVMIHLFTPAQRARYRIEELWKDAAEVPLAKLARQPAKRRAKK